MPESENNGRDRQGRFRPGMSGNPKGKPPGARDVHVRLLEALESEGEKRGESFFAMVARRCFEPDREGVALTLGVLKKLVPDLSAGDLRVSSDEITEQQLALIEEARAKLHAEYEQAHAIPACSWNRPEPWKTD